MQFITTFDTNFVTKFITKFGDSLNSSPNLVTNSSQNTLGVLVLFVTFHHLFFHLLHHPPPPSPTAATPVSLKVRVRDFCYSLTVIFLLYNNVCIVFSITIFNIKFKCGLGLLDELYYLVPRPNHLAICLVIINVI